MYTSKKYLSILSGLLFVLAILLTGCAKDEAISPLSEDALFKSIQDYDAQSGETQRSGDEPIDDGDITDDEDDEDDTDRSDKH